MSIRQIIAFTGALVLSIGMASVSMAAVDVSLNIRYNDPADPNEGGTWTLVAKSDTPNSTGIVGLGVRLLNMPPAGTVNPNIGHDIFGGTLAIATFGLQTEFGYGQDPGNGLVLNVGLPSSPSNLPTDVLRENSVWGNASIIATGSIADLSDRPTFVSASVNERINGVISASTIDQLVVRGDSWEGLSLDLPANSLKRGDVTRNGQVTTGDLSGLLAHFSQDPPVCYSWDDGDFTDDCTVNTPDLSALLANFNTGVLSAPIASVPEPHSAVLLTIAAAQLAWCGRRKR